MSDSAITEALVQEVEAILDHEEKIAFERFASEGRDVENDPCAYLGCGRIGLRDRGGIKWMTPRYVSELAIYKSLMSLPAPLRGGWQWQQGVKCEDVSGWKLEDYRTS